MLRPGFIAGGLIHEDTALLKPDSSFKPTLQLRGFIVAVVATAIGNAGNVVVAVVVVEFLKFLRRILRPTDAEDIAKLRVENNRTISHVITCSSRILDKYAFNAYNNITGRIK